MVNFNIVVSLFLLEFFADILLNKIFKINSKFLFIVFLQVPKICVYILIMFVQIKFWVKVLLVFVSKCLCVLFLTDSFRVNKMASLFFLEQVFLFSIKGFTDLILLLIKNVFFIDLNIKISKNWDIFIKIAIILYIFAIFITVRNIEKYRFLKQHLAKVSFLLYEKNISFYGLIDSGNSLVDPLTQKPVILISMCSLKKILSQNEIDDLINRQSRFIFCETISENNVRLPIFDVKNFVLVIDGKIKKEQCLISVINKKFENGKYDCLLHRDFL